jgi:hypothetical protein
VTPRTGPLAVDLDEGLVALGRVPSCRWVAPSSSWSSATSTSRFCPTCGSTVLWEPARKPDATAVALGAFADPAFPGPAKEVHVNRRHHWVPLLG